MQGDLSAEPGREIANGDAGLVAFQNRAKLMDSLSLPIDCVTRS
jgi:hypothetical protein